MCIYQTALVVVLLCVARGFATVYPSCDDYIIDNIIELWGGTDEYVRSHSNDLSQVVAQSPMVLTDASLDEPLLSENPKCVYADFTPWSVTFSYLPQDGFFSNKDVSSETFALVESNGVVMDNKGIRHYLAVRTDGVVGWYCCNSLPGISGNPQGTVFVSLKKTSDPVTNDGVLAARLQMEELGMTFGRNFSQTCLK